LKRLGWARGAPLDIATRENKFATNQNVCYISLRFLV
jgi:hypothetical protein